METALWEIRKTVTSFFYEGDDTSLRIKTIIEDNNVWLTQKQLAELYGVTTPTINEHIKNVFEQTEQKPEQVVRKIRITANDGKLYNTNIYNLDMIISIGYRVNSAVAIKFRQWATERLHEYIVKGFTMDDERLKQNGGRYFRELLQRIHGCLHGPNSRFFLNSMKIFSGSLNAHKNNILNTERLDS